LRQARRQTGEGKGKVFREPRDVWGPCRRATIINYTKNAPLYSQHNSKIFSTEGSNENVFPATRCGYRHSLVPVQCLAAVSCRVGVFQCAPAQEESASQRVEYSARAEPVFPSPHPDDDDSALSSLYVANHRAVRLFG